MTIRQSGLSVGLWAIMIQMKTESGTGFPARQPTCRMRMSFTHHTTPALETRRSGHGLFHPLTAVLVLFLVLPPAAVAQEPVREVARPAPLAEPVSGNDTPDQANPGNPGGQDPDSPLSRTGVLQKIADPVSQLVRMQWHRGQLQVRLPGNHEEIEPHVSKIRELTGYGGGSGHYGGDAFRFDLNNEQISGYISRERNSGPRSSTTLLIEERESPGRSLLVEVKESGELRITLNDGRAGYLLRIRQGDDGAFQVQELQGVAVFSGSAPDFDSFCRQYRYYVNERLTPVLEHIGLGKLTTPFSPQIQQQIVACLRPWQDDELVTVGQLTRELDCEDFSRRQAASEELEKQIADHQQLLLRVSRDRRFGPEIRARIRTLIRDRFSDDQATEMEFVDQLLGGLDSAYLEELIRLQTDEENRAILVGHLQTMTGQSDVLAGPAGKPPAGTVADPARVAMLEVANPAILEETGPLQDVREHTGALVKLVWQGDQLALDREHWSNSFDGRPVAALVEEVEQKVAEAGLPAGWFQAGGAFDGATVHPPQILFERLGEAGGKPDPTVSHRTYHYHHGRQKNGTPNREFETVELAGRLEFVRQNRNQHMQGLKSLEGKPFLFSLKEKNGAFRTLMIEENGPGELRILVTGDQSAFVLQMVLGEQSALVQDIRGDEVIAHRADSLRQLIEENPAYFEQSFFPLLRHLGIRFDPAVMAEPGSRETTSRSQVQPSSTAADRSLGNE